MDPLSLGLRLRSRDVEGLGRNINHSVTENSSAKNDLQRWKRKQMLNLAPKHACKHEVLSQAGSPRPA